MGGLEHVRQQSIEEKVLVMGRTGGSDRAAEAAGRQEDRAAEAAGRQVDRAAEAEGRQGGCSIGT